MATDANGAIQQRIQRKTRRWELLPQAVNEGRNVASSCRQYPEFKNSCEGQNSSERNNGQVTAPHASAPGDLAPRQVWGMMRRDRGNLIPWPFVGGDRT